MLLFFFISATLSFLFSGSVLLCAYKSYIHCRQMCGKFLTIFPADILQLKLTFPSSKAFLIFSLAPTLLWWLPKRVQRIYESRCYIFGLQVRYYDLSSTGSRTTALVLAPKDWNIYSTERVKYLNIWWEPHALYPLSRTYFLDYLQRCYYLAVAFVKLNLMDVGLIFNR